VKVELENSLVASKLLLELVLIIDKYINFVGIYISWEAFLPILGSFSSLCNESFFSRLPHFFPSHHIIITPHTISWTCI
jgi:hypothetical protein